jgi:hypothetical protein
MSIDRTKPAAQEEEERADQAREDSPVEQLPDPPERSRPDTHPVDGDVAVDPAIDQEALQRPRVQG